MDLKELIGKPCSEQTDDELEASIQMLSKLKLSKDTSKPVRMKSNKAKQGDDLLSKLTPEQIEKLKLLLGEL